MSNTGHTALCPFLGPSVQQWTVACSLRFALAWTGGFRKDDQVELLIDNDAGSLHLKKNGRVLGAAVASRGSLPVWEPLRWAVVGGEGDAIRVQCTDPMLLFN